MNCNVMDCTNNVYAKEICRKHYMQVKRNGCITKTSRLEKNKIVFNDYYAEIILCDNFGDITAICKISLDQVEKVSQYKWCFLSKNGYVSTCIKGKIVYLHRLILNADSGDVIDHIDRDKLNNITENLRLCNKSQNGCNIGLRKNNKSGVTGVFEDSTSGKWIAEITVNNKTIRLGNFISKDKAIKERRLAEKKYHKEFTPKCAST